MATDEFSDRLKKFDRTLRSPGTVQYFRSVHTKLTNEVEFQLFSVCGFTVCPCAERYFSRSKMAQSRPQCFYPLTRHKLGWTNQKHFYCLLLKPLQRQSCSRVPQSSSSLAVMRRRAVGSRLHNGVSMQLRFCHTKI